MKCEKCGKNEANTYVTEIINGQKKEYHLCSECAEGIGLKSFDNMEINIGNFLGGIFGSEKTIGTAPEILKAPAVCKNCGMTVEEFSRGGKLGCSECYSAFRGRLIRPLRQIHGSCEHIGKVPERMGGKLKISREISKLEAELNHAVMEQNFEEAAEIRDKIRELRSQNDKKEM